MSSIVARGVSMVFETRNGEVQALDDVTVEISDAHFACIVGASGCGKSTLLNIMAGLIRPTAGTIEVGERPVEGPGSDRGMVFQSYALFPHLTVEENIGVGLEAREVPKAERRRRVAEAARVVGCESLLERRPRELSGGERQRVALARAFVRDPDVYLLDEPLSNLDAQLRIQMRAELKELHRRVGATMVYVTHDQVEALTLGDRLVVLDGGELQQSGTPDELFRRPANRFVARFIGSPPMNVLPAAVADGALQLGTLRFPGAPATDRPLEAGIRPEHLGLVPDSDGEAEVHLVEPAGSEAFVHLRLGRQVVVARVIAEERPEAGARVRLQIAPQHLHLFDRDTGERVEWKL